jgi:hypothetical protein
VLVVAAAEDTPMPLRPIVKSPQNAISVASVLLLTEASLTELPEEKREGARTARGRAARGNARTKGDRTMKTVYKCLALVACGLLGGFLLGAGGRPGDAQPPKEKPAPASRENLAGERHAPMLLDPSLKVAARTAVGSKKPHEGEDLILPKAGMMRVALDILVDGRPLPTVQHGGKTYLPVPRMGEEYQIRVWNDGPRRVAAVVSVDGLSVITGQPASETGPGYVVAPYSHILIKGWRRNLDNVAAFRFVEREKSYASLMGKAENIGVIGLVAIEERIVHPLPRLEKKDSAPAAKGARTAVGSIGTEYGREIDSRAYYVPFLRSSNKETITLYYDSVKALRAAGVPVDQPLPNPFPGDLKFAPPPPGYPEK